MVTGMLKSPLGTAAMSSWEQRQFCQQCSNLRTSLVFLQLASISFCSWPPYSWPPSLSAVGFHTFLQLASILLASISFCSWSPYSWPPYLSAVGLYIFLQLASISELRHAHYLSCLGWWSLSCHWTVSQPAPRDTLEWRRWWREGRRGRHCLFL